jgi:hypothetical protein
MCGLYDDGLIAGPPAGQGRLQGKCAAMLTPQHPRGPPWRGAPGHSIGPQGAFLTPADVRTLSATGSGGRDLQRRARIGLEARVTQRHTQ